MKCNEPDFRTIQPLRACTCLGFRVCQSNAQDWGTCIADGFFTQQPIHELVHVNDGSQGSRFGPKFLGICFSRVLYIKAPQGFGFCKSLHQRSLNNCAINAVVALSSAIQGSNREQYSQLFSPGVKPTALTGSVFHLNHRLSRTVPRPHC